MAEFCVGFLNTKWRHVSCNISIMTRLLVDNIRTIDPHGEKIRILCLVTERENDIKKQDQDDAKKSHVDLVGAIPPEGDTTDGNLTWLNIYANSYYSHVLTKYPKMTHIIAHIPYMPHGPLNMKRQLYKDDASIKTILFNHEKPFDGQHNVAENLLHEWCKSVDKVISIGYPLYDETEDILTSEGEIDHSLYLPGCPAVFVKNKWSYRAQENVPSDHRIEGIQNILFPAVSKVDIQKSGLQFPVAAEAVSRVANHLLVSTAGADHVKVKLTVSGPPSKEHEDWKKDFHSIVTDNSDMQYHNVELVLKEPKDIGEKISIMKVCSTNV